jgi:hypothetical protein
MQKCNEYPRECCYHVVHQRICEQTAFCPRTAFEIGSLIVSISLCEESADALHVVRVNNNRVRQSPDKVVQNLPILLCRIGGLDGGCGYGG